MKKVGSQLRDILNVLQLTSLLGVINFLQLFLLGDLLRQLDLEGRDFFLHLLVALKTRAWNKYDEQMQKGESS